MIFDQPVLDYYYIHGSSADMHLGYFYNPHVKRGQQHENGTRNLKPYSLVFNQCASWIAPAKFFRFILLNTFLFVK